MSEATYQPKVYRDNSGDRQVIKSGGVIQLESGARIRDAQAAEGAQPAIVFHHDFVFPHSSGVSALERSITIPDGIEIIDAWGEKTGGGSSATTVLTAQVLSSTGGAISNALNMKAVDNTIVRVGTLNDALKTIAPGGSFKVARAGSVGTSVAGGNIAMTIHVAGVKRSTA